jgi:hypothetical protein
MPRGLSEMGMDSIKSDTTLLAQALHTARRKARHFPVSYYANGLQFLYRSPKSK